MPEYEITWKFLVNAADEDAALKAVWRHFPNDYTIKEVTKDGPTDSDRSDRQD